jgi:hypothetical protein
MSKINESVLIVKSIVIEFGLEIRPESLLKHVRFGLAVRLPAIGSGLQPYPISFRSRRQLDPIKLNMALLPDPVAFGSGIL